VIGVRGSDGPDLVSGCVSRGSCLKRGLVLGSDHTRKKVESDVRQIRVLITVVGSGFIGFQLASKLSAWERTNVGSSLMPQLWVGEWSTLPTVEESARFQICDCA